MSIYQFAYSIFKSSNVLVGEKVLEVWNNTLAIESLKRKKK